MRELECESLLTVQPLELEVLTNAQCDGDKRLDGKLVIEDFVHVFKPDFDEKRGFHSGEFRWFGNDDTLVHGTLSGISNAGTHRDPLFEGADESCNAPGFDEGRLCGTVEETNIETLKGAQIVAVYLLRYEKPAPLGPEPIPPGFVEGTLEGALILRCP